MTDTCHELTEGGHLLGFNEMGLGVLQLLQGRRQAVAALGQIAVQLVDSYLRLAMERTMTVTR